MKIGWVYLDKKSAALRAVKDYRSMDCIIRNYKTAIEEARTRMQSTRSSVIGLAPGSTSTLASGEERIAKAIDSISVIKERYQCAVEYMNWFLPGWNMLNEGERKILSEFYQNNNVSRNVMISNLSCELFLERAQIYRYKDKALERLALMLYGI